MKVKHVSKWNGSRKYMYQRLVSEFGPHKEWHKHTNPLNKSDAIKRFYAKMAIELKNVFNVVVTPKAVEQQVAFAISHNKSLTNGFFQSYILNKASAIEAGFIDKNDLPVAVSFEY